MKKVISLLMVMCMLLGSLAISASADGAAITVAVGSVKNGDVYAEGANIVLTATTNAGNISHIDFKANGDKIPGTLIGGEGSLIWYAPAAGKYQVTAEVYCVGNENAAAVSSPVIVTVEKDVDITSIVNMDGDLSGIVTNDYIQIREASSDYTVLGSKSLKVGNFTKQGVGYAYPEITIDTPALAMSASYNPYIYVPVYNAGSERIHCNMESYTAEGTFISRRHNGYTDNVNGIANAMWINPGWNLIFVEHVHTSYYKTVESVKLKFSNGYGCTDGKTHPDALLYIGGVFYSETMYSAMEEFTAVSTSIPNGKTNVCNELTKYRINFSDAIASNVPSDAVKVFDVTNSEEEVAVEAQVTGGADFIDVTFATGALAMGKDYKVVLGAGKVANVYGKGNAAAEFTFSTIPTSCDTADPIPSVTYPAAGENVSVNTALAAKVIFNGNVSAVEFYDGDTKIGDGVNYTGNEYVLKPADGLTEGSHTITVKAITESGEYTSDAITINAGAKTEYALHGIADGDKILINDKPYHMVSVIDAADVNNSPTTTHFYEVPNATDVAKVEYYIDGVEKFVDTLAPYTFNMTFEALGEHTLDVTIYDILGNVTKIEDIKFELIHGTVNSQVTDYFEDAGVGSVMSGSFASGKGTENVAAPYTNGNFSGNVLQYSSTSAVVIVRPADTYLQADGNSSIVRLEFDYARSSSANVLPYFQIYGAKNTTEANIVNQTNFLSFERSKTFPCNGASCHVTVDFIVGGGNTKVITYLDGVEYGRKSITGELKLYDFRFYHQNWSSTGVSYLDNIEFTSYDITTTPIITKNGSTVTCINPTSATSNVEFDVINAGYTDANKTKLVSASKDSVTVLPGAIFSKTYPSISDNNRIFVWDKNLAPIVK